MPTSIAAACMFVSGTAALVYEVLWVRDLGYTFGSSAGALSAVVAAFLAGLACGAFFGGRRVSDRPGLLRTYAVLELLIALWAPLAPWCIAAADRVVLSGWIGDLGGVALLARFGLAFLLLLPATACMGATLPLLCTAFAGRGEPTGALIGRLYGWNTLGGVMGCLLAGFVLVETVGLWKSRFLAAALNLALVVLALWLSPRLDRARQALPRAASPPRGKVAEPALTTSSRHLAWPLWALTLAVTSGLSITLEFGWTRLMALGVGGTTYSFSIVLALYLGGLGLGSLLYAAIVRRGGTPLPVLIGAQLLLGAVLLGSQPWIDDWIAGIGSELHAATGGAGASTGDVRARLALALGSRLVLLPAVLLGMAFPALSDSMVARSDELGRGVGVAYLVSTLGGVAASLLTHFVVLPAIGLETMLSCAALGSGAVGALLLLARAATPAAGRRGACAVAGAAALVTLVAVSLVLPEHGRWDARAVYGGVGLYGPRALHPERALLEVRDGASCSVAVFRQKEERSLAVNGKVDATSRGDMGTQLLLAWLPQLLAAEERETFVLGYGAGVTVNAAARFGGRVLCAEIEDEVLAVSRHFSDVNGAAHADPRVELVADDGRALLRRTDRRFDVITTEPSNPWLAGMAALFTVEFYELCRSRLAEGGVLCQWVQLYWSSPDDYHAIFATLGSVFPQVAIWRTTSGDTLMLAAERPLHLDLLALERKAATRPFLVRELAASAAVGSSAVAGAPPSLTAQLARMVLLQGDEARAFAAAGTRRIRDDVPFLEFTAARNMQANSVDAILDRLVAARRTALYQQQELLAALPAAEQPALLRDVAELLVPRGAATLAEPLLMEARRREPQLERLAFWWWLAARERGATAEASARLAELEQRSPALLLQVSRALSDGGEHEAALAALDRLERRGGGSAASFFQRGAVFERMGRKSDAAAQYERSLKLDPRFQPAKEAQRRLVESRSR
jgi:spermidine synthase